MKIALLQTPVDFDKEKNLDLACKAIREAAQHGAALVILPEMFCCPYSTRYFADYAEPAGGHIWQTLSASARENNICLVGGSFPEWEDGRIYNTCFVFGPDGKQIARHRKMHLFNVEFDGGQHFRESDTFTPGEDVTTFRYGD
ncbi:MAG: carbon-nitrogen hydrolase family protein, partial [Clostridia bacterium]|nr:carbon-nitrogen hydrolase family protein [Clostridia bacterium]